jgi:hypothetical protein
MSWPQGASRTLILRLLPARSAACLNRALPLLETRAVGANVVERLLAVSAPSHASDGTRASEDRRARQPSSRERHFACLPTEELAESRGRADRRSGAYSNHTPSHEGISLSCAPTAISHVRKERKRLREENPSSWRREDERKQRSITSCAEVKPPRGARGRGRGRRSDRGSQNARSVYSLGLRTAAIGYAVHGDYELHSGWVPRRCDQTPVSCRLRSHQSNRTVFHQACVARVHERR